VKVERRSLNAYSELVNGVVLPAPMAGHPALEFCNTLAGWAEPDPTDYLKTYDHLAVWSLASGQVEANVAEQLRRWASGHRIEAEGVLREARALRASVYSVALRPRPGREWDRVAAAAREAACLSKLEPGSDRARWRLPGRVGLRLPVLAVASPAAALLTSDDARHVRACPGRACGWLFLDRSGRRRWCTMATCGNRAKARRFTERHRANGARVETSPAASR
jgi:predicted RNA-binding Zn ribbon-like protein